MRPSNHLELKTACLQQIALKWQVVWLSQCSGSLIQTVKLLKTDTMTEHIQSQYHISTFQVRSLMYEQIFDYPQIRYESLHFYH